MTEMEIALLKRIEALEKRVPLDSAPAEKKRSALPYNRAAYKTAFRAWISGNNKPLYAYMKVYRVPPS